MTDETVVEAPVVEAPAPSRFSESPLLAEMRSHIDSHGSFATGALHQLMDRMVELFEHFEA